MKRILLTMLALAGIAIGWRAFIKATNDRHPDRHGFLAVHLARVGAQAARLDNFVTFRRWQSPDWRRATLALR